MFRLILTVKTNIFNLHRDPIEMEYVFLTNFLLTELKVLFKNIYMVYRDQFQSGTKEVVQFLGFQENYFHLAY